MTAIADIRLLIADTDDQSPVFADAQLQQFITMSAVDFSAEQAQVYAAAAMALRSIASNQTQVRGRTKELDVSVDGVAEADALRKLAADYDKKAAAAEAKSQSEAGSVPYFDVMVW